MTLRIVQKEPSAVEESGSWGHLTNSYQAAMTETYGTCFETGLLAFLSIR